MNDLMTSPGKDVMRGIWTQWEQPTAAVDPELQEHRRQRREAIQREYVAALRAPGDVPIEQRDRFEKELGYTIEHIKAHRVALRQAGEFEAVLAGPDPD